MFIIPSSFQCRLLFVGDDELLCNRLPCSSNCSCRGFSVDCTGCDLSDIPTSGTNNTIRILRMSHNNLSDSTLQIFHAYRDLVMLYMTNCCLTEIPHDTFKMSELLRHLDLSYNSIMTLPRNVLRGLNRLHTLILSRNQLRSVEGLFSIGPNRVLYRIVKLDLSMLNITNLPPKSFQACPILSQINLSFNPFVDLPAHTFSQSPEYLYIDLKGIHLHTLHSTNIYSIKHVKVIDGEIAELCCLSQLIEDCRVRKATISSCRYMISSLVLQTFIWINGTVVTILNSAVIYYRLSSIKIYKKWSTYTNVYIINMAIADLIMGLYVLCLAIVNISYMGRYASVSRLWRMSSLCKILAMLSSMASEVSLITLLLLTCFQFFTIQLVYGVVRRIKLYVTLSLLMIWSFTAVISLIPILDLQHFGGQFLAESGTCLLYQLSSSRKVAQEYSIAIWLGGNLLVLFLMASFQLGLGVKVYKSNSRVSGSRSMKTMHTQTLFVVLVVAAVLCWSPVLITLLLVNTGVNVKAVVSEYLVILMLPLKSMVNPLLYTLRTMNFKKRS